MKYSFLKDLADIINAGQSRTIAITGNINDLFHDGKDENGGGYFPLIEFLVKKWNSKERIFIYTDNKGCIVFPNSDDKKIIDGYWLSWRSAKGNPNSKNFSEFVSECNGNSAACFELLRQLCLCSRQVSVFKESLIIVIQNADLYMPECGDWSRLSEADRKRTSTCLEWFSDSEFSKGNKIQVILTAESKFQINNIISSLPQLLEVHIPSPNCDERLFFIDWYGININDKLKISGSKEDLARLSAGLSIHSLNQLLTASCYDGSPVELKSVIPKVEEFIKSQIGDDAVEFKKPTHKIDDLVGFRDLKAYLKEKFIPRIKATGEEALSGAAVSGAIGCHPKGQKILLSSGETKNIEKIKIGEKIAGPSGERTVLSLVHGFGKIYMIKPIKGDSFLVNDDHILSLVRTNCRNTKTDNKSGEILDVSLKDWLLWSKTMKSKYKLFKVGFDFLQEKNLPIEPYFLGIMLGDGSFQTTPIVTTKDKIIVEELEKQAKIFKLKLTKRKNSRKNQSSSYAFSGKISGCLGKFSNTLAKTLNDIELFGKKCEKKFIPHLYKVAKKEDRLRILAGLIDSDGSLHHGGFDFINKSKLLAMDFVFIARSLGLYANIKETYKKSQNGTWGKYWRVNIYGDMCHHIPTRIKNKKAKKRLQKKNPLRTGFSVEYIRRDNFYGFVLDGDGRYLLDDFTVTHNCGKTFCFEAVAGELDMPVLVLKNLRSQWYGQTDVIIERLRRTLEALGKVLIFVDEADTQFGGVGSEVHETERRLTGKIQQMMSDTKLKGKIIWLLMTARIHQLSPDIRRPGRVGDLIIPIFDPVDEDHIDFVKWMIKKCCDIELINIDRISEKCKGFSAANFSSIRSELIAAKIIKGSLLTEEEVFYIIDDILPADISEVREYQELQALLNCTRRSLLPKRIQENGKISEQRVLWLTRIKELEAKGIK